MGCNKEKEFKPVVPRGYKTCTMCGRSRSDVKLRKTYDYINGEWCEDLLCSSCHGSIIEDSMC